MADDAVHVITTKSENLEETLKDTVKGVMEGLPKDQSSTDSRIRSASLLGGAGILGGSLLGSAFGAPVKPPHQQEVTVNINGHPYSVEMPSSEINVTVPEAIPQETVEKTPTITFQDFLSLIRAHGQGLDVLSHNQDQTKLRLEKLEGSVEALVEVLNNHAYTLMEQSDSATEDVAKLKHLLEVVMKKADHNASQGENLYDRTTTLYNALGRLHKALENIQTRHEEDMKGVKERHDQDIKIIQRSQDEGDFMNDDRFSNLVNKIEDLQSEVREIKLDVQSIKEQISHVVVVVGEIISWKSNQPKMDAVMQRLESYGEDIAKVKRIVEQVWSEVGVLHDRALDNYLALDYLLGATSDVWEQVWLNRQFVANLQKAILATQVLSASTIASVQI